MPSDFTEQVNLKPQRQRKAEEELKRKAKKKKYREERKIRKLEKELIKKNKEKETIEKDEETDLKEIQTVSIALPGSILDNAQSPELRTYLAGQIARACVIFKVDEIIVFGESGNVSKSKTTDGEFTGIGKRGNSCVQLARILQYLECPQYLRKFFFPRHPDLRYAGLLNPLDSPHHMRVDEDVPFRDGVVLDRPTKNNKGSFVNCGALKNVQIDKKLESNVRVTVQMLPKKAENPKYLRGKAVGPTVPKAKSGIYWGYTVRLAESLSSVFTECTICDAYDVTIGTSERGNSVDEFSLPTFQHLLIVFGGLRGLEASLAADEELEDVKDPALLFNHYLNTCPEQGSRTIRTEEAILITMSSLRPKILSAAVKIQQ